MTGRRELWEVARFSGPRRGFQPQCDCYRTDDPPALHLLLELPGVDPEAVRVILPRENEPDLEELPSETRGAVRFVFVDSIDEVFDAAFSMSGSATNGRVHATSTER